MQGEPKLKHVAKDIIIDCAKHAHVRALLAPSIERCPLYECKRHISALPRMQRDGRPWGGSWAHLPPKVATLGPNMGVL